jgi:hypothetical protein
MEEVVTYFKYYSRIRVERLRKKQDASLKVDGNQTEIRTGYLWNTSVSFYSYADLYNKDNCGQSFIWGSSEFAYLGLLYALKYSIFNKSCRQ